MKKNNNNSKFPIAIVGIGCRYPGKVNDPESYWNLLINKVDAISEIRRIAGIWTSFIVTIRKWRVKVTPNGVAFSKV